MTESAFSVQIQLDVMSEISDAMAKELQAEIDKEVLDKIYKQILVNEGWHCVFVPNWRQIDSEWTSKYIKGGYQCFGHYWYFEKLEDATYFTLKWK